MSKIKCSVCGAEMEAQIDLDTNKPYPVQMCSNECVCEAWNIVTDAIRQGKRPVWSDNTRRKRRMMPDEEKAEIIKLYGEGKRYKEIAAAVGRSEAVVGYAIRQYKIGKTKCKSTI